MRTGIAASSLWGVILETDDTLLLIFVHLDLPPPSSALRPSDNATKISGSIETYYFGEIMHMFPDLKKMCTNLMPDDAQRENTGVEGEGVVAVDGEEGVRMDSARRVTANRTWPRQRSQRKKNNEIVEVANIALDAAVSRMGLDDLGALLKPGGAAQPPPDTPSWRDSRVGCEDRAAHVDLFNKLVKSLPQNKLDLKEAEKDGETIVASILKKQRASLTKAMEEEAEQAI